MTLDLSSNLIYDLVRNFTDFITEKCQVLLNEYDEFYCVLIETIDGVKTSKILQNRFNELFIELGCDDIYEKLISGNDFEVIFRNILSSSLVKLAQLMTDLLDSRYSEIRMRKMSIQKFMQTYLVLEEEAVYEPPRKQQARENSDGRYREREDIGYEDFDDGTAKTNLVFHQYDNDLYESI